MEMICVLMCHTQENVSRLAHKKCSETKRDADSCEHRHNEILYNQATTKITVINEFDTFFY